MADIAKPSPHELKNLKPALPDVWDLAKLEASVNSTSQRAVTQWLAYLSLWAYLFFTTLSITDRALILLTPVKLPLIGVELGVQAFFWSGPPLFLVFHLYLVRKITVLARDVGFYRAAIQRFVPSEEAREPLYRRLDAFFLTRLLGHAEQGNLLRLFDGMIALATVAVMPLALMLAFQLRFLAFHDEYVTMWHRVCLVADVGLLVLLARWLKAVLGDRLRLLPEVRGPWLRGGMDMARDMVGPVMAAYVAFSLLVATFSGEVHDGIMRFPGQDPDFLWRVLAPRDVDFVDDEKLDKVQWTIDLRGRNLRGAQLSGADLRKARMTGVDLSGAVLSFSQLQGGELSFSKMNKSNFSSSQLIGANLFRSELDDVNMESSQLKNANMEWVVIKNSNISRSNLEMANLTYSNLVSSNLSHSDLHGSNLSHSNLKLANMSVSDLKLVNLSGSYLEDADLSKSLLQGSNLSHSKLSGVNFRQSLLRGADLSYSNMQGANLSESHLQGANLSHSYLEGSNLSLSQLQGADFSYSLLSGSNLIYSQLQGANFSRNEYNQKEIGDLSRMKINANKPLKIDSGEFSGKVLFDIINNIIDKKSFSDKESEDMHIYSHQFKGSDLRMANFWRSSINGSSSFELVDNRQYVDYSQGNDLNDDSINAWISSVPAGEAREHMIERMVVLRAERKPDEDVEHEQALRQVLGTPPPNLREDLTRYLDQLVCHEVGEAIHGIVGRVSNMNSTFDRVALAKRLLDPSCLGEKHLRVDERENLRFTILYFEPAPAP